jgi:hypothetical protein
MLIEGMSAEKPFCIDSSTGATGGANNRDDPWVYR